MINYDNFDDASEDLEAERCNICCRRVASGCVKFSWFLVGSSYVSEIVGGVINDESTVYIAVIILSFSTLIALCANPSISDESGMSDGKIRRFFYGYLGMCLPPGLALVIVGSSQDKSAMHSSGVALLYYAFFGLFSLFLCACKIASEALGSCIVKTIVFPILSTGSILMATGTRNDNSSQTIAGVSVILITLVLPVLSLMVTDMCAALNSDTSSLSLHTPLIPRNAPEALIAERPALAGATAPTVPTTTAYSVLASSVRTNSTNSINNNSPYSASASSVRTNSTNNSPYPL